MPKMKSRRAVAKRFRVTGDGKLKFKRGSLRHNLSNKSSDVKRKYRKPGIVNEGDEPRLKRALVYL